MSLIPVVMIKPWPAWRLLWYVIITQCWVLYFTLSLGEKDLFSLPGERESTSSVLLAMVIHHGDKLHYRNGLISFVPRCLPSCAEQILTVSIKEEKWPQMGKCDTKRMMSQKTLWSKANCFLISGFKTDSKRCCHQQTISKPVVNRSLFLKWPWNTTPSQPGQDNLPSPWQPEAGINSLLSFSMTLIRLMLADSSKSCSGKRLTPEQRIRAALETEL